ncbi:hypothetical protein PINS_up001576 [Pythium insidiosum]|nr:hypothetical protein PINS_up001576 [Pythium insidiosum]
MTLCVAWFLYVFSLYGGVVLAALEGTSCTSLRVPPRDVEHMLVHISDVGAIDQQALLLCDAHGVPSFRCGMVLRQLVDTLHDMAEHDVSEAIVNVSLTYSLYYSVRVDTSDHMITIRAEEPVHKSVERFCQEHGVDDVTCSHIEPRLQPLLARDWGCLDALSATASAVETESTLSIDSQQQQQHPQQVDGNNKIKEEEEEETGEEEGHDDDSNDAEYLFELERPTQTLKSAKPTLNLGLMLNNQSVTLSIADDEDVELVAATRCHAWSLPPAECRWLLNHIREEAARHPVFQFQPRVGPLAIASPVHDRLYPMNQRVYLEANWTDGGSRDVCMFIDLQQRPAFCGPLPPPDVMFMEKNLLSVGPHVLLFTTEITDDARDPDISWVAARHITVVAPSVRVLAVESERVGERKDEAFLRVTVETSGFDTHDPTRRLCLLFDNQFECVRPEHMHVIKRNDSATGVLQIQAPVFGLRDGDVELLALLLNEYNDAIAISAPLTITMSLAPHIRPRPRDQHAFFAPPGVAHRRHPERCAQRLALATWSDSLAWLCELWRQEWGHFSQNGEDGVLHAIFAHVGVTTKRYVEFGAGTGDECNTRLWREHYGWDGVLLDAWHEDVARGLHRAWVTAENVNALFEAHAVPREFDLLSIDVDFNDFWLLSAIDRSRFSPRVIVIEVNSHVPPNERRTVRYDPQRSWDAESDYFGVGVGALELWGRRAGYSLVYCETRGVNCFLVRDDVLLVDPEGRGGGEVEQQTHVNDVLSAEQLHHAPNYFHRGLSYVHQPATPQHAWVWLDRENDGGDGSET